MKTIKLIVSGDVQRVGYRNQVKRGAKKWNIKGQVQNLENETVQIIAQGSLCELENFKREIFIQGWPIHVEKINEQKLDTQDLFEKFKIVRGELQQEMAERLDVAALYLQKIDQETSKEKTLEKLRKEAAKEKTLQQTSKETTLNKFSQKTGHQLEKICQETSKEKTLDKFTNQTNTEFKGLDLKYGSFSKKLDKLDVIAEKLDKLANALIEIAHKA